MTSRVIIGVSAASVAAVIGVYLWGKWKSSRKVAEVTQLYTYPIKSCHRIELTTSECSSRGLKYDRCWTIAKKVEDGNKILSQTQYPKLAAVVPELRPLSNGKIELHITAPGMSSLVVPEELPPSSPTVVSDGCISGEGQDVGDEASQWFSKYLGIECRMYYMSPSHQPRYFTDHTTYGSLGKPSEQTSFANTSSLLVVTENALDDLNSRLQAQTLPIDRFRGNIVLRIPEDSSVAGRKHPEMCSNNS
ncbi:mitochondrial amidoxime-reducing component 1-like isoform X2 [Dysidea avara]|uniref:mitochondrial amidoxime-reducing component 1-like isoform X2 n=1 Tax=Dysidea avara TaxID=196820 RepID=UPI00331697B5